MRNLEKVLIRSLVHTMRQRLNNWGSWHYQESVKEIKRLTGIKGSSPIYQLMKVNKRDAIYTQICSHDASILDKIINQNLSKKHQKCLYAFYAEKNGMGNSAECEMRRRVVNKLAVMKICT